MAYGKRLAYQDRRRIEDGIREHDSFRGIAKDLGCTTQTVSAEVKRNSVRKGGSAAPDGRNVCARQQTCEARGLCGDRSCTRRCSTCRKGLCNGICPAFEPAGGCPTLQRPPFVCNVCPARFGATCRYVQRFYEARAADDAAAERRAQARKGLDCTEEELKEALALVRPLMRKGQSIEHIWAAHGDEIPFSARSFYRYIQAGVLDVLRMDLPKQVKYKPRNHSKGAPAPRASLEGRTYEDFLKLDEDVQASAVEMDSVVGRQGEPECILTLLFRRPSYQIYLRMDAHDQDAVAAQLDMLEALLGLDGFKACMSTVLTDRGSEFLDYGRIERSCTVEGERRCQVFYCDPLQSGQKGRCEKAHVELRKVIPKGTSMKGITKADLALACSHVSSTSRRSLGGLCPYDLASMMLPEELTTGLGVHKVPADEVTLKPSLLGIK